MADRFERVATGLIVASAIAVAAVVVRRELAAPSPASSSSPVSNRTASDDFRSLLDDSAKVAYDSGSVVVVQFSDMACPFCRRFHLAMRSAAATTGIPVRNVFVHFPLPQHRFAIPAAKAAECARDQGRFDEFVDAVFERQDSLGLRPWTAYARDASIHDTLTFRTCAARADTPERVALGRQVGERLQVSGTPTVLINGWRYAVPPYDSMPSILRAIALEAHRTR